MTVKQVSVFIENKPGRLAAIIELLADNNIDISALSLADTSEFGILRLIVSDVEKAKEVLSQSGVIVKITHVTAVAMEDSPGGASGVLRLMADNDIAVEYMYACTGKTSGKALMIARFSDSKRAQELLDTAGYGKVKPADIYRI